MMVTPSIGSAWWVRRGQWPPATPGIRQTSPVMPNPSRIEAFFRKLARIQEDEDIGFWEDAARDLAELPPALRELPAMERRRARLLERLGRIAEALEIYERTERCALADLGRVRCLARLRKSGEARRQMAAIPFDAALVKEFVETRDLLN